MSWIIEMLQLIIGFTFNHCTRCTKSNGSYDIKDFEILPLIFSTSKYSSWKFQPCLSFYIRPNIPDKWKGVQLSLDKMKKKEKVKVKSWIYLAACSIPKMRWHIWKIFFSHFRRVFFFQKGVFVTKVIKANIIA